jgi:hypothetical protein
MRLKCVQEVARFTADHATSQEMTGGPLHSSAALVVHDLIAAIVLCEGRFWICLGEVNGLKLNGQSMLLLNHSVLREETVVVSFQLLGLRPATEADNPHPRSNDYFDWRTYNITELSFDIPGQFLEVLNPEMIVTPGLSSDSLFQNPVLTAVAAPLFQRLETSDLKRFPKMAPTSIHTVPPVSATAIVLCH